MSTELEEHVFQVTLNSAKTAEELASQLAKAQADFEVVSVVELSPSSALEPSQLYALVDAAPEAQRDAVRQAAELLIAVQNDLLGLQANHASALEEVSKARASIGDILQRTREALARSRAQSS